MARLGRAPQRLRGRSGTLPSTGLLIGAAAGLACLNQHWQQALVGGRRGMLLVAPSVAGALGHLPASWAEVAAPLTAPQSSGAAAPAWGTEFEPFPGNLFDNRKAPVIRWQPFGPALDPLGDSLVYPAWLSGTWKVKYEKRDVRFPQGWGMLNPKVPGVGMASVLRLPNVGAEPVVRWRFTPSPGGSKPDWASMLPGILQAFWTESVASSATRLPGVGWALTYKSPAAILRKGNRIERTVTSTWLAGETWQDSSGGQCLSVEWVRQKDELLAPEGVADYKVLMALRRNDKGPGATGFMRVAAFLQPVDDNFIEAGGNAVAVYEYALTLVPDDELNSEPQRS